MHAYLVAGMHEYLEETRCLYFCLSLCLPQFLWCSSSEWPGETVYLPRLLWVKDVSLTDSFVLLIGMYFKYMCFNQRRFFYNS